MWAGKNSFPCEGALKFFDASEEYIEDYKWQLLRIGGNAQWGNLTYPYADGHISSSDSHGVASERLG